MALKEEGISGLARGGEGGGGEGGRGDARPATTILSDRVNLPLVVTKRQIETKRRTVNEWGGGRRGGGGNQKITRGRALPEGGRRGGKIFSKVSRSFFRCSTERTIGEKFHFHAFFRDAFLSPSLI